MSKDDMIERGSDTKHKEQTIKARTSRRSKTRKQKRHPNKKSKVTFKPILNKFLRKLKEGKKYKSIEFESQQEQEKEQNREEIVESRAGNEKESHQDTSNNCVKINFDSKWANSINTDDVVHESTNIQEAEKLEEAQGNQQVNNY